MEEGGVWKAKRGRDLSQSAEVGMHSVGGSAYVPERLKCVAKSQRPR